MALKKRRISKHGGTANLMTRWERKSLWCKKCGDEVEDLSPDVSAVICSRCCIKMCEPPVPPVRVTPVAERRPRGWQFRAEYRSPDGVLYRRGEKVDETISKKSSTVAKRSGTRAKIADTINAGTKNKKKSTRNTASSKNRKGTKSKRLVNGKQNAKRSSVSKHTKSKRRKSSRSSIRRTTIIS